MKEYINLTLDNIDTEHVCCAIGSPLHEDGVDKKKEWLKQRIPEGHVFRKLNARGKVFIEYAPLEYAWTPAVGNNFMYIYCLWVAGSYKGKGYAEDLLMYAIEDAKKKKKNGLCTISSKKKKPFISDKKFFQKYGFKVVDTIGEYELLALSFNNEIPSFCDSARKMRIENKTLTIYYSNQCPYVVNCMKEIEEYVKEKKIEFQFILVDSLERAKQVPCVFNNWATFKDGEFVSNTLLNKNSLEKLLSR